MRMGCKDYNNCGYGRGAAVGGDLAGDFSTKWRGDYLRFDNKVEIAGVISTKWTGG